MVAVVVVGELVGSWQCLFVTYPAYPVAVLCQPYCTEPYLLPIYVPYKYCTWRNYVSWQISPFCPILLSIYNISLLFGPMIVIRGGRGLNFFKFFEVRRVAGTSKNARNSAVKSPIHIRDKVIRTAIFAKGWLISTRASLYLYSAHFSASHSIKYSRG
jgi:hypothetical protein